MNQCKKCRWYNELEDIPPDGCGEIIENQEREETHFCMSYPDGIPEEIWTGKVKHDKPYNSINELLFLER